MAGHREGRGSTLRTLGLDPTDLDDDADAGAKINRRAARMAVLNVPQLRELAPDLVVSDVITARRGFAADCWPAVDRAEPLPLYRPSKGLPPVGSGLAPGVGIRGRLRDAVMRASDRPVLARGTAAAGGGACRNRFAAVDPGRGASHRDAARSGGAATRLACRGRDSRAPALRADDVAFWRFRRAPARCGRRTVDGDDGCPRPGRGGAGGPAAGGVPADRSRVVVSRLSGPDAPVPPWAVVGLGRQDELLAHADVVICGGGHGMVSKTLLAGVPTGGGAGRWRPVGDRQSRCATRQCATGAAVDGGGVAAAVGEVLSSPRYREAARRAGDSLPTSTIRYGCAMKRSRRRRRLGRVRLTEFHELVEGQFGPVRARRCSSTTC